MSRRVLAHACLRGIAVVLPGSRDHVVPAATFP